MRGWPKGKRKSAKIRRKLSLSVKKYFSNPKILEKARKIWYSPAYRKKLSLSKKKYYSNSKAREKTSRALKRYFSNPRAREKHRKLLSTLAFREKVDRAMTSWWKEHPYIRKEMSIRAKNLFMKNPKKFENFMKYGNNPSVLHLKTKQGFLVRSQGEQDIANFLHDNKIQPQYESKILIFREEGQICVPDFYLPKYKIYLEFYGGHPMAWKKKVLKNKLYRKHKVPCIFITPTELRNLKYYLLGELGKGKK
jgi:hypothetical protein